MPQVWTCAQGHRWTAANGGAAPADAGSCCPVCSAAGELRFDDLRPTVRAPDADAPRPSPAAGSDGPTSLPQDLSPVLRSGEYDEPADPMKPPEIPGYKIVEVLGVGGMGVVYKAWQTGLQRVVALKMILQGAHAHPTLKARFLREAQAVAALQHPHIVQIYEVGQHQTCPFFSLEYVDGGTLENRLFRAPLSPRDAAGLMATLARAMHYAHEHGVVHRDLKPANILLQRSEVGGQKSEVRERAGTLLTSDLCPKIADFGLAKRLAESEGQTQTGTVMGTPSYMAPEQAEGKIREHGPPVDVYALGAILYQMLTGRPPFSGETPIDTLDLVRFHEPVAPVRLQPTVPRDLATISLKCLEKDPHKRYPSARALAEDLERFLRGEPIRARPVGPLVRAAKWARRRPAAAALIVVSAGALLSVLGVSLWYNQRLRSERDLAERQFQLARQAVGDMVAEAAEEQLAYEPRLEKKRRALLAKAQAYYTQFLEQKSSSPGLRQEIALAYERLADVSRQLGEYDAARRAYSEAIPLFARLAEDHLSEPASPEHLADCYNFLGEVQRLSSRPAEARTAYDQARELQQRLAADFPDRPQYRMELARTCYNLGILLKDTQQPAEAERAFLEAIALLKNLTLKYPDQPAYQQHLARGYLNLGPVLRVENEPKQAEEVYHEAIRLLDDLVKKDPQQPEYRHELGVTYLNLGYLLQQDGQRDRAAEKAHRRALELFDNLMRHLPSVPVYRQELANAYNNLAIVHARKQFYDAAEDAWLQALLLFEKLAADFPNVPDYEGGQGRVLGNLGWLLLQKKELPKARTYLEQGIGHVKAALRVNPKNPAHLRTLRDQYGYLVKTLTELGEPTAADRAAQQLAELNGGSP